MSKYLICFEPWGIWTCQCALWQGGGCLPFPRKRWGGIVIPERYWLLTGSICHVHPVSVLALYVMCVWLDITSVTICNIFCYIMFTCWQVYCSLERHRGERVISFHLNRDDTGEFLLACSVDANLHGKSSHRRSKACWEIYSRNHRQKVGTKVYRF